MRPLTHGTGFPRGRLVLVLLALLLCWETTWAATPPEAIRFYNQACDASLAGQKDIALASFQKAIAAGFDDFRFAMADSDLTTLSKNQAFTDLLKANLSRLILLSSEKGLALKSEEWTSWVNLEKRDQAPGDQVKLRLKWQTQALAFEVKLQGSAALAFADRTQLPWLGGPAIQFILSVPDGTSPFESTNSFQLVFGKKKKAGIGALLLEQQLGWQPIGELTPDISLLDKGQTAVVSGFIPWQSILPNHPLVDNPLGLNIGFRASDLVKDPFVLFPDPGLFEPEATLHRYVPLAFDISTAQEEILVGRLNQSLLQGDPLAIDLMVISEQAGTGQLKTNFLDDQGQSVLPAGANVGAFELVPGVNRLSFSSDFKALRTGSYLVALELTMPSGKTLTWSSSVLNLSPGWREDLEKRITTLQAKDQPTALFYLETISQAIASLPPRRHPGSLAKSLRDLDIFVTNGTTSGSILPESGAFLLSRKATVQETSLCSLYFPAGYQGTAQLEPLVFWIDTAGLEERLISRVAKLYQAKSGIEDLSSDHENRCPVFIIPHQPAAGYASLADEVAALNTTQQWVRDYFSVNKLALAGLNAAGGAVLEVVREHPGQFSRVLFFAGSDLAPWPGEKNQSLIDRLTPIPAGMPPITWIDFFKETRSSGQGKMLLSVLKETGYNLASVQKVDGALTWIQSTDRLVLWLEKRD